jgi:hypothetical protein
MAWRPGFTPGFTRDVHFAGDPMPVMIIIGAAAAGGLMKLKVTADVAAKQIHVHSIWMQGK